ncbi:MAG: ergothioneine biosynthesis protein EgtB [Thermoanaerobaculia bacterium]
MNHEEIAAAYRAGRDRSKHVFDIARPDHYYDRPIKLRNPIAFYEGHLPAFNVNTLIKRGLGRGGVNADYEILFERGIDPEDEGGVKTPNDLWPSREKIQAYGAAADRTVEKALQELDLSTMYDYAVTLIEHEFMHQETLLYMFHNMAYADKVSRPPLAGRFPVAGHKDGSPADPGIRIPAGVATLGADRRKTPFAWDNEFPEHRVEVGAFTIDRDNVTNAGYLDYMNATGTKPSHFWLRKDNLWFFRGMFDVVPLPLDWPVYVSHDEATGYARWKGRRLPTEGEYHRAAFGTPSGEERDFPWGTEPPDSSRGNFGFANWDPVPVGSYPAGTSAWGVRDLVGNGWEWTSTTFDGFPGFEPMRSYPVYSTDFFDGQHYVLKGASPSTGIPLIRRTFRNWFRPNYPYLYATFRCVW